MNYEITPNGELIIDKYAPFSPEETKHIFEDLKQLTQLKVHGYRMTMDPDTKVRFGCMSMAVADINAFYEEYRSGRWKQIKLGPWHVKEKFMPGDKFMNENDCIYMICQIGPGVFQLISLQDGNRWNDTTVSGLTAKEVVGLIRPNKTEEFTYVEPT